MKVEFRGQAPCEGRLPPWFKVASLRSGAVAGTRQVPAGVPYVAAAYEGVRLVGVGQVTANGAGQALIDHLIVDPEFRGWGIGSRLLQMLVAWSEGRQIHDIRLSATQANRGFFERNGFAALPESEAEMQYSLGWDPVGNGLDLGFVHALEHVELEALGS